MNKMMKTFSYLILACLFAGITGCAVGPDFEKPVVRTPNQYIYAQPGSDSILNLEWWSLFQDPQLDTLIRIAMSENRDVRIAALRVEEARASVKFTRADTWPTIGYQGNVQSGNLDPVLSGNDKVISNYYVTPFLSWELDFWGKYRRATESAKAEFLATEYAQRSIMISLISEVANTYFQLLDYDNRLYISRRTLESRREYLRIIKERYAKGIVAEIDVNQAEIQEAIAASSVPHYERLVAITENALSILIGRNPGYITRGLPMDKQVIPPDIPPGLPSQIMERRPDILQAEQIVAAQNARIGIAQAMRFPSISLTGLLGAASPDLTLSAASAAWAVSGGLLGPLFNFGKNKQRVEIERKRTEEVLMVYEQVILQAFQEVENGLVSVSTYKKEYEAVYRQTMSAKNAAGLSRSRYDGGVTSYLEVLDSDRTLFDAELNASQTLELQFSAYVNLYKALGGGWISREEKAAAEQAAKQNVNQTK